MLEARLADVFGVQVGLRANIHRLYSIGNPIEMNPRSSSGSYSDFALMLSRGTKRHAMLKMIDL